MNASQIVTSLLLGLSLSMDADCVSAVYGLKYTKVKITKLLFFCYFVIWNNARVDACYRVIN